MAAKVLKTDGFTKRGLIKIALWRYMKNPGNAYVAGIS